MLPILKLKNSITILTLVAFCLQLSGITVIAQRTSRQSAIITKKEFEDNKNEPRTKISPDLDEKTNELSYGLRNDETQKVIIQLNSEMPLDELSSNAVSETGQKQMFADEVRGNKEKTGILMADLREKGGKLKNSFDNLGIVSAELPLSKIRELVKKDEVAYVSVDHAINPTGHVNDTTGADLVRNQTNSSGASYSLDGTGIGIAIIDSGLFSSHKSFLNSKKNTRVKFSKDFTGENRVDDPFGHGTHVATAAAGYRVTGTSFNRYEGIAWNADIINLRVLNSQGTGTTSGLLSALDWVLTNKSTYKIRVVNLSLGTPAIDSYTVDPLCKAVRKLADAGVVVVAAAGNDGKNSLGQKQYGTIHSPGNEPSAITVGATNTFGTDARADDIVTTYSSRGPTRSYKTDSSGIKHYDNLIKPDIVAPGNKLIYAESDNNLIVANYPNLDAGAAANNYRFMYMSGSSMATPITAGAAALLLQANPNLRPNMVKMILTYTAQQLANYNMLEQGAGQLNIEGAVRLANAIKTNLPTGTALGAAMLTSTIPPIPLSYVAGTTFPWSQGIIFNQTYGKGFDLITKYQKIYDLGVIMGDGTKLTTSGVLMSDTTKMTGGVSLGTNIMTSNGVVMGDGTNFLSTSKLLGNGVLMADRTILGDGVLMSDGVLMADGVLIGDNIDPQGVLVNGDNTSYMLP
jgi:subtilisin family serine protease